MQRPVPEASLEVNASRAKRSRDELGHGDAPFDPRGGDRSLERRVEPGDAGKRPGHPRAARERDQAGLPANRSDDREPRRGRSKLAGQLGLMALPPEPHAAGGHLPRADRALGADPLDALAHRGRLEAETLGCRGKGERVRLRPPIGVEPTDLDRPRRIRIPVEDAAFPDLHHGEPRRHRADGDGVGQDRERQSAAPRSRSGHLDPREGHADHESPTPEALEPDADVGVVESRGGCPAPRRRHSRRRPRRLGGRPARDGKLTASTRVGRPSAVTSAPSSSARISSGPRSRKRIHAVATPTPRSRMSAASPTRVHRMRRRLEGRRRGPRGSFTVSDAPGPIRARLENQEGRQPVALRSRRRGSAPASRRAPADRVGEGRQPLSDWGAPDVQLPHAIPQRARVQPQALGRLSAALDRPPAALENLRDVGPLQVPQ